MKPVTLGIIHENARAPRTGKLIASRKYDDLYEAALDELKAALDALEKFKRDFERKPERKSKSP